MKGRIITHKTTRTERSIRISVYRPAGRGTLGVTVEVVEPTVGEAWARLNETLALADAKFFNTPVVGGVQPFHVKDEEES